MDPTVPPKPSHSRRHIYCLSLFLFFSLACVVSGLVVGYGLRVKNFDGVKSDANGPDTSVYRTVFLESELISVDPLASTLVMNWYISDDNCFEAEDPESVCTPVGIYFDTNLLQSNDGTFDMNRTNLESQDPIFTWYPADLINSTLSNTAVFRTTSLLFNNGTRKSKEGSSLQNYPFDTYGAYFIMYGKQNATDDQLTNVVVDYSYGVAVGFKATSDTSFSDGSALYLNGISLERSGLIKAYVVSVVIGVWLITLIFVGSVMKVLFGYKQPKEALGVPIATLFAFSSLRGTMPGAPAGFGAIMDFVGILPCLSIITLTGVVLFGYLVISNSEVTALEPPLPFTKNAKYDSQSTFVDSEKLELGKIGNETPVKHDSSLSGRLGMPGSPASAADASFGQPALQYEPFGVVNK